MLVVGHKLGLGEVTPANLSLSIFALLAITAGTLYQKRFVAPCDVRTANAVQLAAALVVTAPLAWLEDGAWQPHPELLGAMAWSVLALTLGGSSLLYMLIQRGAATRVASLMYLVPPCTAVMAWLLFGEALGASVLAGFALTAVGVWLVVLPSRCTMTPAMFEDFTLHDIDHQGVRLRARRGGDGPPLLLLHGHPQTHAMWHAVAGPLAQRFSVVAMDLRGRGDSTRLPASVDHALYSKRAMAADAVAVMRHFGFERFAVCAHDRGARVAHRLALDHPDAPTRMMLLDIAPTLAMYEGTTEAFARAYWHWFFLIQDAPLPERAIEADPSAWLREGMGRRFAGLGPFAPEALAEYERCIAIPAAQPRSARTTEPRRRSTSSTIASTATRGQPRSRAAARVVGRAGRGRALLRRARPVARRGHRRQRHRARLRPLHCRGAAGRTAGRDADILWRPQAMTTAHRIAVIAGDGIGKEVMPESLRVLAAAARRFGIAIEQQTFEFADCDYYARHGKMMPDDWKAQLGGFDAILFGAVGWPATVPDHVSLWGSLLKFRREFDQYVNLRPGAPDAGHPLAAGRPQRSATEAWRYRHADRAREHRGRIFEHRRAHVRGH